MPFDLPLSIIDISMQNNLDKFESLEILACNKQRLMQKYGFFESEPPLWATSQQFPLGK
jgi:hypothetical protein